MNLDILDVELDLRLSIALLTQCLSWRHRDPDNLLDQEDIVLLVDDYQR